ncbi:MAG: hypothetical protein JWN76_888 [Chitinophagaceae bacterium]|nr:hypothetical protein [Chitinophagaceae bacterium]
MVYRVIGLMSGSSLDGLDIAFVELEETGGNWSFNIKAADCIPYSAEWQKSLKNAVSLNAKDYLLLHCAYGHYTGRIINEFIEKNNLDHQVQIIASHGHTTFHVPGKMTAQLGDGAAIAAETGINVISDLRSVDVAFGGQGAPIVPMGEKLFWPETKSFLNLGGIANISFRLENNLIAYDVCPANRVLNMLAAKEGKEFDEGGKISSSGYIDTALLSQLNSLPYYQQPYPKSLANEFGSETVFSMIEKAGINTKDALRTYTEHIALQISYAVNAQKITDTSVLVTGGGAFNNFLIERINYHLQPFNIHLQIPSPEVIQYKEALVMALLGVLRWREENTILCSVTGASRSSIGGAVWMGQEA